MIKSKKQSFVIIGAFIIALMLFTTTYAFFNYTRTGTANTIKTGRIAFTSSQSGTINLTNVFPIERSGASTDNTNSSEVVITVTGDTTYSDGIEYLLTVEDVNMVTSTNKKVPIGIIVDTEMDNTELGTEDTENDQIDYFTDRGGDTSYYKVLSSDVMKDGDYILVGYIRPGVAEVNGKIGIRAFIDKDKIAISDTYDSFNSGTDNMGTTSTWVAGRTVLTTTEWNSLQGNNAISFKVKVQANEGIWVGEPLSRNDMKSFSGTQVFTGTQKASITEISFIRMSEEMINTHADAIDLTESGGEGGVKAWIDGTKLYIASPGETYLPEDSSYLFNGRSYSNGFTNLVNIEFKNINTSLVENMEGMFLSSPLEYIDISSFDTSNVENMNWVFQSCSNLIEIDISNFDTTSVTEMRNLFDNSPNLEKINISGLGNDSLSGNDISGMFSNCSSLREVNLSNFKFGSTTMQSLFYNLPNLEVVNLSGADTSNVTSMSSLFSNATSIEKVDLSGLGSDYLTTVESMFYGCTSLKELNMNGFNFGSANMSNMFGSTTKQSIEVINLSHADASNTSNLSYLLQGTTSLKTADLSYFKANTTMNSMFYGCTNLETVNLSHIDTSNVTDMEYLFMNCRSLKKLDLSDFDTSKVQYMRYAFKECSNLEYIDFSNGGNSNIYIYGIFDMCRNLKEINMSGFTFGENMDFLFQNLVSLEKIDLSNSDTSNTVNMSNLFQGSTRLTTIDISSFDTSKVTSMSSMFDMRTFDYDIYQWLVDENKLTTLLVGNDWDTSIVTSSSNMFNNCTHLVGGNGTTFDSDHTDKAYAHIDGGTSDPGYLTLKTN